MENPRFKFRVWDKVSKRYFYLELKFGDNGYHPDFITDPVFEQCTGLKDKNGNLIYEGDIVKIPDDYETYGFMSGEKREVYFCDGGFRLKPKDTKLGRGHWLEQQVLWKSLATSTNKQNKRISDESKKTIY